MLAGELSSVGEHETQEDVSGAYDIGTATQNVGRILANAAVLLVLPFSLSGAAHRV